MNKESSRLICIACSVFQSELETLRRRRDISFPIRYLSSTLHMHPVKLYHSLDALLKRESKPDQKILLVYGDCHAHMHEHDSGPNVCRVRGVNCPEILLGKDTYSSLLRQGAFFLLPEWTMRWREIFQTELGLKGEVAKAFMKEMHTRLVYLDTGQIPVPKEQLKAITDYAGLPWEILKVSPDYLLAAIREAIKRLRQDE
jgi:hypothetical protein